jgi:hypothetical protein
MQMNEARCLASEWVQRAAARIACMIDRARVPRQTRLKPIRGRGPIRIAPARPRVSDPTHAIASAMVVGWCRFRRVRTRRDNRDANSIFPPAGLKRNTGQVEELRLGTSAKIKSAKIAAILLLPIALAACAGGDEVKSITYTDDRGVSNQPFPNNNQNEILSVMKA